MSIFVKMTPMQYVNAISLKNNRALKWHDGNSRKSMFKFGMLHLIIVTLKPRFNRRRLI